MTSMDNSEGGSPRKAGRTSISLPSALRPARVSISNNYQMDETSQAVQQDQRSAQPGEDVFVDSAKAFDTVSPDGKTANLQSSPLSATKRLYGGTSSNNGRPLAGAASRGSIIGQSDSKNSPLRRGRGDLPSILPSSAFLTPRKPSQTPRYSQTNSAGSTTPTSAPRSTVSSTGGTYTSPSSGGTFAAQQLQPSLFLANQSTGPRVSYATGVSTSDTSPLASAQDRSSLFRSGSISTQGHANASYANANNTGTVGSTFGDAHARDSSQQGTIRSKTSREPLIAGASDSISHEQNSRRKNSKTGSISGLLGLRNSPQPSTSPRQRQESYTMQQDGNMPTLAEANEKSRASPARPSPAAFRQGNVRDQNSIDSSNNAHAHTVVHIISSKTNKPMRNYQIYRELQRQHKSTSNSVSRADKEKPSNPALAYGRTDYGGNNRFLLGGRLVTSGDSPFPFIASFLLSVVLVGTFFAFEAQWLWDASSSGVGTPGGKAIIFLFLYAALIMWTSMLRTSLRDPGIIVKGLDSEPDWESIAVPVGGEDDLTGTGMGQRPKLRYFRVRDENVSSKCECPRSSKGKEQ